MRKRATLLARVSVLDKRIEALGGTTGGRSPGRAGGRPRNEMTLNDALERALKGKTLSVNEAAEAVQKAGYRTSSRSFRVQVNVALIKGGKFKRVGRGQYALK
jgi:hypothetical protein